LLHPTSRCSSSGSPGRRLRYVRFLSANPSPRVLALGAPPPARSADPERERLVRRARRLAHVGLAWHGAEASIFLVLGIVAGSVALVGFGADSLVEAFAGIVVLWRLKDSRSGSATAERRAQQLIAWSFWLIAAYITVDAGRALIGGHEPDVSWLGIAFSVVTLIAMPVLARAKAGVGHQLGSSATVSESRQTMLCAYLSAALLTGLLANAALGWWWADPVTGLVIAAMAAREGREAWRGEQCGCCP
jgi:divalent metal cation (Fe/Co/Zn/Cd) transporter